MRRKYWPCSHYSSMTWLNFNHTFGATGKGQLSQICLQDASSLAWLRSWKSHTIKSIVIGTIQLVFGGIEVSWWQWPPSTWRLATAKTKCCKVFLRSHLKSFTKKTTSPWQPFLFSCFLAVPLLFLRSSSLPNNKITRAVVKRGLASIALRLVSLPPCFHVFSRSFLCARFFC